ncbi:type II toxin-antitoxin system RelE/ParE family toxin [Planomonospora sp. ID67723]|uniref:type II toxin-antitoxin system RelE/ParE family toxin n=1 Tax=Planomonospora sp. ID67723 TaxID=2738134 RepID=UPI0018C4340E|nr:type II toxin-antitoxin system RelE/ParE family toxin [Planomonospora sp. ID67723]MBG0830977.1 type II toxin-antitoxin system RelE/ParE family toxin [Planomonospora sp. ID67723]
MSWQIVIVSEVRDWLHELRRTDRQTLGPIAAALDRVADEGPSLGRPLVDTLRGSAISNLKELRPGSRGRSEVRLIFFFDPWRQAVFLVAGDKSEDWDGWYGTAIKIAEERFARHMERKD